MKDYRSEYGRAASLATALERVLASNDANDIDAFGRTLALEGRPLGFYMTRVIRHDLGDDRLKTLVGDPFAWYLAFTKARQE